MPKLHRGMRAFAVLGLIAPLAGSLMLATAPAALAGGSITSPAAEAILRSGSSFKAEASVTANSAQTTLTLEDPARSTKTDVVERNVTQAQTLSIVVQTGDGTSVRNGRWTVSLSGGASGSRVFWTSFAPATPSGFTAQGSGPRDVAFSWTKGSEPDLTGYALYGDNDAVIDDNITTSACSGTRCSYALYYPNDNPGTHGYKLAARRPSGGCSGCGSQVVSGTTSSSATLTTPPPPPPSPTPTPTPTATGSTSGGTSGGSTGATPAPSSGSSTGTTGGSTPGATSPPGGSSTGGSTTGGASTGSTSGGSTTSGSSSGGAAKPGTTTGSSSTGAQPIPKPSLPSISDQVLAAREKFALQFKAFSPSLGIPKLAPLPALALPRVSGGAAPLPEGTFLPSLPYDPLTETEPVESTGVLAQPVAAVRQAFNSDRLMRSLAGAMILLMAGAHVRRFLGTATSD